MRLDDALAGVTKLGFDTPPFIYLIEQNPKYLDRTKEVLRRVDAGVIHGYTSVVTLTEVLTQPLRAGDLDLERTYRDFLLRSRNLASLPIDAAVAERAAQLRARHNLRTPDALQIAAALIAGCQAFLTNDGTLDRVDEIDVLVLDELEL